MELRWKFVHLKDAKTFRNFGIAPRSSDTSTSLALMDHVHNTIWKLQYRAIPNGEWLDVPIVIEPSKGV